MQVFHFAAKTFSRSGRSSLFNPVWCFTPSGSSVLSPQSSLFIAFEKSSKIEKILASRLPACNNLCQPAVHVHSKNGSLNGPPTNKSAIPKIYLCSGLTGFSMNVHNHLCSSNHGMHLLSVCGTLSFSSFISISINSCLSSQSFQSDPLAEMEKHRK